MPDNFNNPAEQLVRVNSEIAYKLKANIKTLNEEKRSIFYGRAILWTDLWRAINRWLAAMKSQCELVHLLSKGSTGNIELEELQKYITYNRKKTAGKKVPALEDIQD